MMDFIEQGKRNRIAEQATAGLKADLLANMAVRGVLGDKTADTLADYVDHLQLVRVNGHGVVTLPKGYPRDANPLTVVLGDEVQILDVDHFASFSQAQIQNLRLQLFKRMQDDAEYRMPVDAFIADIEDSILKDGPLPPRVDLTTLGVDASTESIRVPVNLSDKGKAYGFPSQAMQSVRGMPVIALGDGPHGKFSLLPQVVQAVDITETPLEDNSHYVESDARRVIKGHHLTAGYIDALAQTGDRVAIREGEEMYSKRVERIVQNAITDPDDPIAPTRLLMNGLAAAFHARWELDEPDKPELFSSLEERLAVERRLNGKKL